MKVKPDALTLNCPWCRRANVFMNIRDELLFDATCNHCNLPVLVHFFKDKDPVISKRRIWQPD